MLEHMGALGIDADAFSHRAIAKGAPGYGRVVETFGRWVVGPDGEIDRAKLGRLVFSDPSGLAQLSQEQKMAAANMVIRNTGAFEDTWRQVMAAWQKMIPAGVAASAALAP